MDPFGPLLGAVMSALGLVFWGTPVAIGIWLVAHRRAHPKSNLRPGIVALALWAAMALATFVFLLFSAGGHTPPSIQMLAAVWALGLVAVCARMLWTLYGKIGLPRR